MPYPTKFKLPLEFLTLQDWNNFVQNLLFINQYGPGKLLQYYQNGNFQNLDEVIAKYLCHLLNNKICLRHIRQSSNCRWNI